MPALGPLSPSAWRAAFARLRRRTLVTHSTVYVLGGTLQKALGFLLIPLYTRFIPPAEYGIVGMATAIEGVLTAVLGFGLHGSLSRYYFDLEASPDRLRRFITTHVVFLAAAAGCATLLLDRAGADLWPRLTSGSVPFTPYIRIVLWTSLAGIVFQVPLTLFVVQRRAKAFLVAQLANFLLTIGVTIVLVVGWQWGALGQLLGRLVATGAMAVVVGLLVAREWFAPRLSRVDLALGLAYGLPLIPHMVLGWVMNLADRLLLDRFGVPLDEIGRYTLGYQVGWAMSVLVASINMAWTPYYFNLMKVGSRPEQRVAQIGALYTALVGGLCLIGVLFGDALLGILAPPQFHAAARFVPLVLFAYLLNGYYFFAVTPLFHDKKTAWISAATTLAAVTNVALNVSLIPRLGALGAAWATVGSYAAILAVVYALSHRRQPIPYPRRAIVAANALIFAAVLLATYARDVAGVIAASPISPLAGGWTGWGADAAWRVAFLAAFALLAYDRLVRPNIRRWDLAGIGWRGAAGS